jgi:hypothetical protein
MTNAGLYAEIGTDGKIEIAGGTITDGTFKATEIFGLESEPYIAMVTGNSLTETVITHKTVDLQTQFVADLGVTRGYVQVETPDGTMYYEKIYEGQTIADFMADMGNLGIYTSLDEDAGIERVQSNKKESKQNRRYIDCLYSVVMWFGYLVKIDRRLIMNLEKEFAIAKAKHKIRILVNKMIKYFEVIEKDEVNLSGIYYKSPKDRAIEEIIKLLKYDIPKFESLYETAYKELEV